MYRVAVSVLVLPQLRLGVVLGVHGGLDLKKKIKKDFYCYVGNNSVGTRFRAISCDISRFIPAGIIRKLNGILEEGRGTMRLIIVGVFVCDRHLL